MEGCFSHFCEAAQQWHEDCSGRLAVTGGAMPLWQRKESYVPIVMSSMNHEAELVTAGEGLEANKCM